MIYKMIQKFAPSSAGAALATRALPNAPEDKVFFVHGGGVLRNLKDLRNALQTMSKEIFVYHVNSDRNDFATWVGEVLAEKELAKRLRELKSRGSSLSAVIKHLKDVYSL